MTVRNFWADLHYTILGSKVENGVCQCCGSENKELIVFDLFDIDSDDRQNVPFDICHKCASEFTNQEQFHAYYGFTSLADYLDKFFLNRFKVANYISKGSEVIEIIFDTYYNPYLDRSNTELISCKSLFHNRDYTEYNHFPKTLCRKGEFNYDLIVFDYAVSNLLNCLWYIK